MNYILALLTLVPLATFVPHAASAAPDIAGLTGPVGARPDARRVQSLRIDKPGCSRPLSWVR